MDFDDTEERDGIQALLIRISHQYFANMYQQLSATGIHPGQIPMIRLLGKHDGLSQKEIAQMLRIKPPTVTVSLKRMENAGLIERRADTKDQRIVRIYLSAAGVDIYKKMKIMVDYNEKHLLKDFTESEMCLLQRFLKQMLENVEQIPSAGIFEGKKNKQDHKEERK